MKQPMADHGVERVVLKPGVQHVADFESRLLGRFRLSFDNASPVLFRAVGHVPRHIRAGDFESTSDQQFRQPSGATGQIQHVTSRGDVT